MKYKLDKNWRIEYKNGHSAPAKVPGDITADLHRAGVIKEPYYGINHQELGWIIESDFVYQTMFDVDEEIFNKDEILLTFDGIDTFAEILLNGKLLGTTQNMFLQYEFRVKENVKRTDNVLEVRMISTKKKMSEIDTDGHFGIFNTERLFIRKTQCHFGWDWAPNLPGYGIYKAVWLSGVNKHRIVDTSYRSYTDGNVQINVELNYDTKPMRDYYGKVIEEVYEDSLNTVLRYSLATRPNEEITVDNAITYEQLVKNKKNFANFKIPEPKLWWPSGYGEQPMYSYKVELLRDNEVLDFKEGKLAIREVCLSKKPVAKDRLECKFIVNDVPVFAKGSNWVPIECFLGEATREKYERLLTLAKQGNFNMLRVWGGGVYEDDAFYDICDELGIMVWQDMMFACADIPEDRLDFLENVKDEIVYQIKRLRNHPCIVLWSGGNEKVGTLCKQPSHGDYFMEVILRGLITNLDESRPYVKQSPFGMNDLGNETTSGDSHTSSFEVSLQEGVDKYRDFVSSTVASFVSECAVMGPGSLESVKKMFPADKIWPMNEYWDDRLMDNPYAEVVVPFAERQKQYATALYGACRNIEDFICKGMTAHAEVMRAELEYARSNKGKTWGFMNWMYSDCWPSGNWSVVDYYCEPKQVYYQMKRSFAPILLTFVQTSDFSTKLCVINDTCKELRGAVEFGMKDLNGRVLWKRNIHIDLGMNDVFFEEIVESFKQPNTYLYAKGILNGEEYTTVYSYNMWSGYTFESDYVYDVKREGNKLFVTFKANRFAKGITLRFQDNANYVFSDNYFDLELGEEKTIIITGTNVADIQNLFATDFAKETTQNVAGYDIVIIAGQSNAEGCGVGPVCEDYKENEDILYLTGKVCDIMTEDDRDITYPDKTLTIDIARERITESGKNGDLALAFADEYVKRGLLAKGRKVLIVRAALGGTGFQRKQWGAGCVVEERMHEMIEYALALHEGNRIVAFLWHQGEHDAFEGNAPENYKEQLTKTMNTVRERYHCEDAPFIAGDFCHEWKNKNLSICIPIVNVIREVFFGEKYGFVETSDLLSNNQKLDNGDDIHFCREALYTLGKRYFRAFREIELEEI